MVGRSGRREAAHGSVVSRRFAALEQYLFDLG
jgi:hypothetical protein